MAKFPGGEVTAEPGQAREGDSVVIVVERWKMPVLGLKICKLGTCWG